MSLHWETLYWFGANQYLLLFLYAAKWSNNTKSIINFYIWPGLEPTISNTRGENSTHNTTYVVRCYSKYHTSLMLKNKYIKG